MGHPLGINTHAQMVYRPGERELAMRVLKLLGRSVVDKGRPWLFVDNWIFLYEVPPKQWEFEQKLTAMIAERKTDPAIEGFLGELDAHPQQYCHFGATLDTMEEWETLTQRVRDAGKNDPALRGRIEITSVLRPGDPGHVGSSTTAFVRTDVFSSSLLTFGQIFEMNYYAEGDGPAHLKREAAPTTA
jgi:hypothetical protein